MEKNKDLQSTETSTIRRYCILKRDHEGDCFYRKPDDWQTVNFSNCLLREKREDLQSTEKEDWQEEIPPIKEFTDLKGVTHKNPFLHLPDKILKGDQTPPCNVCRKPFKWENHFNVAIWDANEWEIETFWVHIECNAHTVYADHVKELGKVRITYKDGKGKFEILEGE